MNARGARAGSPRPRAAGGAGRAAQLAPLLALALLAGCPAPPRPVVRPAPDPRVAASPRAERERPSPAPRPDASAPERAAAGPERTVHRVQPGETIWRIARAHGVEPAALMEANGISDPRTLAAGAELVIPPPPAARPPPGAAPGPARPLPAAAPALSTSPPPGDDARPALSWPLRGVLYGRFGVRGGERHDGIDIAAPEGTPVHAAADGTVLFAGDQQGHGKVVILRHAGGLVTVYAHNSAILVPQGARVARGEPIARVGQTGRTSGPHLHFEVREGTRPVDPLLFLK